MTDSHATPLSDCIAALRTSGMTTNWDAFVAHILSAPLGVVAQGVPAGVTQYRVRGTEVGLGRTRTPDGRLMILACADPAVFRRRFPLQPFNADMDSVAVFRTALAHAECAGILINSAATAHSLPLDRRQIADLISRSGQ